MKLNKRFILPVAALALLLTACSPSPSQPETEPTQPTQEVTTMTYSEAVGQTLSQDRDEQVYSMQLTQEMVNTYTRGKFTILRHYGGDRYIPIYFSDDVTLEDDTLTANFNGKILYMVNDAGMCYALPATQEDARDGMVYCTADIVMGSYYTDEYGQQDYDTDSYTIHTVFDQESGEPVNQQITPYAEEADTDLFVSAPILRPVTDSYANSFGTVFMATYDDQGTLCTMNEWSTTGSTLYEQWPGGAGMHVLYGRVSDITAPYPMNDVYMVITAYGEDDMRYDSPFIPIDAVDVPAVDPPQPEQVTLQWSENNTLLLADEEDVQIYLCKAGSWGNILYDLQICNNTGSPVTLYTDYCLFNGQHFTRVASISADAGQWGGSFDGISFPLSTNFGQLEQVTSIDFSFTLENDDTGAQLIKKDIHIDLSGTSALTAFNNPVDVDDLAPFFGFFASQEQILAEEDGVRFSVLRAGRPSSDDDTLWCFYRAENTTDQWRNLSLNGIAFNDVSSPLNTVKNLQPGEIYYNYVSINDFNLLEAVGSLKLNFSIEKGKFTDGAENAATWHTITPDAPVDHPSVIAEGDLLLEEKGLRVTLLEANMDSYGTAEWKILVYNDTQEDLCLQMENIILGDDPDAEPTWYGASISANIIGAQQCAILEVSSYDEQTVSFQLSALNLTKNKILFKTDGHIKLSLLTNTDN